MRFSCLLLLASTLAAAQQPNPRRIADLNASRSDRLSSPRQLTPVGPFTWFASTDAFGRELWVTDGSSLGTHRVTDLVPGSGSSNPTLLGSCGTTLLFSATRPDIGSELFAADGPAASQVRLVKDIAAGAPSGLPAGTSSVTLNGFVYFAAGPSTDVELWKSDCTAAGTVRVLDINPGAAASSYPSSLTALGNKVVFSASTAAAGGELWVSDGTALGTQLVLDIDPGTGSSAPSVFFSASPTLIFFSAYDPTYGSELWKTDGTPGGTTRISDIRPGSASSNPYPLVYSFGELYFGASGPSGYRLWLYTAALGVQLVDISPGSAIVPRSCFVVSSQIYCTVDENPTGFDVFTVFSTNFYAQYAVNPDAIGEGPQVVAVTNNGALLGGHTANGYHFVTVGAFGLTDTGLSSNGDAVATGGNFIVAGSDGASDDTLWTISGYGGLPSPYARLRGGTASSSPNGFIADGSRVLFFARESFGPRFDIFQSSGTAETTFPLATGLNLYGSAASMLAIAGSHLVALDSQIFWGGDSATLAGWQPLGSPYGVPMLSYGGSVFFASVGSPEYGQLWATDGTSSGTRFVADPNGSLVGSNVDPNSSFALVTGGFVFSSGGPGGDYELWFSDGTTVGTHLVKDLCAGSCSSSPRVFASTGTRAFFFATTAATGYELYVTDGTAAGTQLLELTAGAAGTNANVAVTVGDRLFFTDISGDLWTSDGTLTGSLKLATAVNTGAAVAAVGTKYCFAGDTMSQGRELWVTDATVAGTNVLDVQPGLGGSSPTNLTGIGGALLFSANGGDGFGSELWRTDGTVAGTKRVSDISPGAGDASPKNLFASGAHVYFAATDSDGDEELYAYDVDSTPPNITPTVTGTLGANGFYVSDVHVHFDVTDGESPAVPGAGCGDLVIDADTASQMVTCSAQSAGGTAMKTVVVQRDTRAPALSCPADVTAEATGATGAMVTLPALAATDAIDPMPVLASMPAAGAFALGTTGVQVTATDAAGNVSTCRFDVSVRDTTAPMVTCPGDVSVDGTSAAGGPAMFDVTATDVADAAPLIIVTHESGSVFPVGTTTVRATAIDRSGNAASCTFKVTATAGGKQGCGCSAPAGLWSLLALLALARRRRLPNQ